MPPIHESRPFLLAALGSGVAALVCVSAVALRVEMDAGLTRMENLVHEERLAHQATRLEKVQAELDAHKAQMADLWRWHFDMMDAVDALKQWNREEDRYLVDLNNSVIDLAEALRNLRPK